MSSLFKYRPEIDGLRTVAVLAVIIFHLDSKWLQGGFLGVDVFFVISGFLITSIIYSKTREGSFSIIEFWKRRIKRLYPALMAMVGVVLLVSAFVLVRPERGQLWYQALGAMFSYENIVLWQTTWGYWAPASENISLLHTWSLSLEEQFYVCFPITLVLINWLARGKEKLIICGLLVASFCLCVYATADYRSPTFYLLPARMWELLIGSVLAIQDITKKPNRDYRLSWLIQIVGITMIITSFFLIKNDESFPSFYPLLPCVGTLLLLMYGGSKGIVQSILSAKPVVYLGKISYSLYLWHWDCYERQPLQRCFEAIDCQTASRLEAPGHEHCHRPHRRDYALDRPSCVAVRKAQREIAKENPRGAWVDVDDLNNKKVNGKIQSVVHYTKEGYVILGRRFARQGYARVTGKKPAEDGRP